MNKFGLVTRVFLSYAFTPRVGPQRPVIFRTPYLRPYELALSE